MNLRIDKAGRIVLPKNIRDRLRLRAGSSLEIEEGPDGIVLRPIGKRPSMIQKDGAWVHLGKLPNGYDWGRIIDDDRDERLKDIVGL